MKPRIDPSPSLLQLAGSQAGVLSTRQMAVHGLGRRPVERLIAEGRWQRLAAGLVFVQSSEPPWLALASGGVLLGGESARLGSEAAAYLHGLRGEAPSPITVLVPHEMRRADRGPWSFVRETTGLRLASLGNPPRPRVEDTVLDLCAGASEREVIDVVSGAIQERRTTTARLRARLAARERISHRSLLRVLLAEVETGAESPLELGYLRDVERAHALPRGLRQHRRAGDCRDVYYEPYHLVVELDGRLGHDGRGRFRDMRRDNRAVLSGEATPRYGWTDVRVEPCAVAGQVAQVFRIRGWDGRSRPCRRCRVSKGEHSVR